MLGDRCGWCRCSVKFMCLVVYQMVNSCVMFEIGVDYVIVMFMFQLLWLVSSIVVISMKFISIGVVVVVMNCLFVFNSFDSSVVNEMNRIQGKQMWLQIIVRLNCLLFLKFVVMVQISYGIVRCVISDIISMIENRFENVFLVKLCGLFLVLSCLENIGMKVVLNVFLVKKWWNMLGRVKVIRQVCVIGFVFRQVVIIILWIKFIRWLVSVYVLIERKLWISLIGCMGCFLECVVKGVFGFFGVFGIVFDCLL